MLKRLPWVVAALLGFAAAPVCADELGIGDPAPKLQVKEFVKGDAVAGLEKGKTYVVEFWATWCGPCIQSIPHVTELQKKYKDITFIGVSVLESKPEGVKPFVEKMGDKMGYRVAMDDATTRNDGKMAETWLKAAGQNGIPSAFIVNGDGVVAWIGHPMVMDKPLAEIAAGTYDLKVAAAKFKKDKALGAKLQALGPKFGKAMQAGDDKEALAILEAALADEPALEEKVGVQKFRLLAKKGGDTDKAVAYAKHLAEKVYSENAQTLNFIAWTVVDPKAEGKRDAKLVEAALMVAKRADELMKGKDAAIADTLAKAYFDSGNVSKAVETQQRALDLAKGTKLEQDESLKERLEQYKKAAAEKQ